MVRLLTSLLVAAAASIQAADLIPLGSAWKYILGTQEASTPTDAWRQIVFNDSTWSVGGAPIGYDTGGTPGTAPIVTLLPDPRTAGNPIWNSAYFRKTFTVADPSRVVSVILTLYVDDGAVIWLNGNEVGRINVPEGELPFNGVSSLAEETRVFTTDNIANLIVAGTNVVAIHALNSPTASSDFVVEAVMNATLDEPPTAEGIEPFPSSIVTTLNFIDVTFSEGVTGVDASDLIINGSPATNVTLISSREYIFSFPQPATGVVSIAWAASPGISDQDAPPDAFVSGASWTYTLDPNVISAPAVISEFLADNEDGIRDEDGTRSDWIELYNPGTIDINLGGWFLTDTTNILTKWRLPSVNLGANKYLLIWASEKNRTNSAAPLHTNFKLSKNANSYLALVNLQTNVVSAFVSYPAQPSNVSYGRDRVDPNLIGFFTTPTPGAQNSTSGAGFAPAPVFSLESGIYTNDLLTLTLSVPGGTTIRYTYDGTEPGTNSPVYAGPIAFSTNVMIKARGFQPGVFPSAVGARTFVMLDNSTRDFTSNVPILIISTGGRAIPANLVAGAARPRGTFVTVDTFRGRSSLQGKTDYQGLGQFEIVGQTSAGFVWNGVPKPPYRIELNDELGNDRSAPLLGMPSEADWSLRSPFTDKCLMNDFLGYELWEDMGHYSCRRRFVEVFVDTGGGKLSYPGDYFGVYVLFERIEIGNDRVDLEKLAPAHTNEPAITGGYIIKKDKDSAGDTSFTTTGGAGHSAHILKFHDPKPSEISIVQSNWIRNYVNRFEASMYVANWTNAIGTNHYSHYIDVDQFVDQHLHVEFTKQIDGYRLSSYYSKDRGGKLKPEPVWDWNLSFGNANYLRGGTTNGWYWNLETVDEGMPSSKHIWLRRLIYGLPVITTTPPYTDANGPGDPDFRQKITDRWAVLRTNVLNGDRITARIDELAAILAQPADRNYARFSGLLNSYTWPNPEGAPYDVDYTQPTYGGIISEMKKWTKGRYVWMDNQYLSTPTLSKNSGPISSSFLLTLSAPAGAIYYTTDGSDPRLPGGGISPSAALYT
ncbi:MAG TPA: CotH kinase family protein, partial [Candidatus Limnocylindria bacterium]|nr:CotH kinase family protein [Candidatus Limnocylindria bacterium]